MERVINRIRSSLLNDSYNSYTELTRPYFESFNTLVDYETELDYAAGTSAIAGTRTRQNGREKLVTHLSSNPTHFEKELRNIVLDIYSESEGSPSRDVIVMDPAEGTIFQSFPSPSFHVAAPQFHDPKTAEAGQPEDSGVTLRSPPYLGKIAPVDVKNIHHKEGASKPSKAPYTWGTMSGTPGYAVDGTFVGESSRILTMHELRGQLESLHFTDKTVAHNNSFSESDLDITPSFDDSGVHLEFVTSDHELSDNEPDREDHSDTGQKVSNAPQKACKTSFLSPGFPGPLGKSNALPQDDSDAQQIGEGIIHVRTGVPQNPNIDVATNTGNPLVASKGQQHIIPRNQGQAERTIPKSQGQEHTIPINQSPGHAIPRNQGEEHRVPRIQGQEHRVPRSQGQKHSTPRKTTHGDDLSEQLIRERANLEGRLETLSLEYKNVLEEKKELQTKVQAMETKMKKTYEQDKGILRSEDGIRVLEAEHENRAHLESQVAELKRFLEARDLNLSNAEERLQFSKANIRRLEEKVSIFEADVSSKDAAIASLEEEINKIKTSLDQVKLQNEDVIKEGQVLNADVSSLLKAKTWYQKQLEIAKDARVKLQLEVSDYESTVASQNKIVETLKCENARTSQQLVETQQRTLEEKARILKHLENVEEDMLNQDAAFKQLQIDKQGIERELSAKINELQEENTRIGALTGSAKTLELQLDTLRKDAQLKESTIRNLQVEKEEFTQQLKIARSVNEVSAKKLTNMKAKLQLNEKELQAQLDTKKASKEKVQKLEEEKVALELQIKDSEDEKAAFDGAVQMLRFELEKVERRFKFMKRELAAKTKQLEVISEQKDGLVHELAVLRDEVGGHVTLLEELRATLRDRSGTIEGLKADKTRLEDELRVLGDRLRCAQMSCAEAEQERKELQEQLLTATSQVSHLEEQFHSTKLEKARLEGELETTVRASSEEVSASRAQTESLKQEMADLQRNIQRELTKQRDEAITLEQQVEYFKSQIKEGNDRYQVDLKQLQGQLESLKEGRETAEKALRAAQEDNKASLDQLKLRYEDQLHKLRADCVSLQTLKRSAERKCAEIEESKNMEMNTQRQRIHRLEQESSKLRGKIETQRKELEKMSVLSIDLERERGRLAGIMTSQKALRQHCASMEESIAKKESALAEVEAQMDITEKEKEFRLHSAHKQVSQLQDELKVERHNAQEMRTSLMAERKECTSLRMKVAESEAEVERIMKKLNSSCQEAENLVMKYERCSREFKDCKQSLEMVMKDLRQRQVFSGKLQSELSVLRERDQVKDDWVSGLEWEVKQRCKEVDYMKEQIRLSEERQQVELENLRTSLQVAKSEATFLRRELAEARASKSAYQTKVFEMKDDVLTSRQETECTKHDLYQTRQQLKTLKAAILDASDLDALKSLIDKGEEPLSVTKRDAASSASNTNTTTIKSPLSSLKECMSSLRSQISSLQNQMDHHTDAIHTSASQWRTFEKNIKDLHAGSTNDVQKPQILSAERDTF